MNRMAGLAMAVLLSCAACTARETTEKEHKDNSIAEDFRHLDANHDGSITKDEVEKNGSPVLQASFDPFDANKDGKLSLQEITAFVMAQREESARQKNEAFRRIDANHDAGISKEEAEKNNDPFLIANFEAIDANKDGKMSLQELNTFSEAPPKNPGQTAQFPQAAQPGKPGTLFMATDTDHNGTLSRDEMKSVPEFYQNFDQMDADHDGKVTPQEIVNFMNTQSNPAHVQAKPDK